MKTLYLVVPLAPLAASIAAGLFGRAIGRKGAHRVTILAVLASFVASCAIFVDVLHGNTFNGSVYTWLTSGATRLEIGFQIDRLSALMMVVVSFVSLMVHVYTIGYMADDPGYQRFFSYISLFTFAMLMLVMSNNFLQLFFGWEAVGLVSYLLIGFWYTRPSAIYANLKAFIVNRVGDFGFLLGIALVLANFGTLERPTSPPRPAGSASAARSRCAPAAIAPRTGGSTTAASGGGRPLQATRAAEPPRAGACGWGSGHYHGLDHADLAIREHRHQRIARLHPLPGGGGAQQIRVGGLRGDVGVADADAGVLTRRAGGPSRFHASSRCAPAGPLSGPQARLAP